MPELEDFEAAQAAEYGAYVATSRIDVGGALAFLPGHAVPASHVERGVVPLDQVAKTNTKAGQKAQAPTSPKGEE